MKLTRRIFILLILCVSVYTLSAQTDRTKAPLPDKPEPLNLGELCFFQLDNGLKVFLANKKGYTKFTVSVNIEQPDLNDDNAQLRSFLSQQLMSKESVMYPAGTADSIVSYLGAQLAVTPNGGFIKGMKRDVNQLLSIYSEALLNPAFNNEIIRQAAEDYKKKGDRPVNRELTNSISARILDSLLGRQNPHTKEEQAYHEYSLQEIKDFYNKRIAAVNTLIVIIGDFTPRESKKLINKYFGNWHMGEELEAQNTLNVQNYALKSRKIFVIDNPNAVQSKISISWNLNDAFQYFENETELKVMNEIFGATAMSYLSQNLREEKGLCYFAVSNIGPSAAGGSGYINTSVRNDQTAYALENIFYEMLRIRNKMVSEHDLRNAKNTLIGSFARSISGSATIPYISFAMAKEKYNLPDDYLQTRISKIYNVTAKDVNEMAGKYIIPYECVVIIEGKASVLKDSLERFGEVFYYTKEGEEVIFNR